MLLVELSMSSEISVLQLLHNDVAVLFLPSRTELAANDSVHRRTRLRQRLDANFITLLLHDSHATNIRQHGRIQVAVPRERLERLRGNLAARHDGRGDPVQRGYGQEGCREVLAGVARNNEDAGCGVCFEEGGDGWAEGGLEGGALVGNGLVGGDVALPGLLEAVVGVGWGGVDDGSGSCGGGQNQRQHGDRSVAAGDVDDVCRLERLEGVRGEREGLVEFLGFEARARAVGG